MSVSRGVTRTPVIPAQKPAVYPLFPDVVLKSLPFYIRGDVLLRPSSLQPSTGGGGGRGTQATLGNVSLVRKHVHDGGLAVGSSRPWPNRHDAERRL